VIEETVTVVGTEGEFAWVQAPRASACGTCASEQSCGTATLSKVLGGRQTRVRALNTIGARAGERVVIGMNEAALVRGSLAVYLVPILALLGGGGLGQMLAGRLSIVSAEAAASWLGFAGLLGGLLWVRGFGRRILNDTRFQPVLLRRIGGDGPGLGATGKPQHPSGSLHE